jgi:hypothetical protein
MGQQRDRGSDGGVGWRHSIALAVAIIAMLGAIIGLFETEFIAEMIRYKNEALLMQNQASDQWSFFQAKTIRSHLYEIIAKVNPRLGPELRESSARYDRELADIKQKAEELEKKAKEKDDKSLRYYHLHLIFALSATAFQVSIALLAFSAFTRSKPLWLFAILISIVGLGFIGFGLLL